MHLLDTDTRTHLHAGHPRVVKHLQRLADPEVGTTIIASIALARQTTLVTRNLRHFRRVPGLSLANWVD